MNSSNISSSGMVNKSKGFRPITILEMATILQ